MPIGYGQDRSLWQNICYSKNHLPQSPIPPKHSQRIAQNIYISGVVYWNWVPPRAWSRYDWQWPVVKWNKKTRIKMIASTIVVRVLWRVMSMTNMGISHPIYCIIILWITCPHHFHIISHIPGVLDFRRVSKMWLTRRPPINVMKTSWPRQILLLLLINIILIQRLPHPKWSGRKKIIRCMCHLIPSLRVIYYYMCPPIPHLSKRYRNSWYRPHPQHHLLHHKY